MKIVSPDGDEGYPGELEVYTGGIFVYFQLKIQVIVKYILKKDTLTIEYNAQESKNILFYW